MHIEGNTLKKGTREIGFLIRTRISKSVCEVCEVYSATIDRPKDFTERVKLIFKKSHKLVGQ